MTPISLKPISRSAAPPHGLLKRPIPFEQDANPSAGGRQHGGRTAEERALTHAWLGDLERSREMALFRIRKSIQSGQSDVCSWKRRGLRIIEPISEMAIRGVLQLLVFSLTGCRYP
ncbi:hypothetical protein CFAM422_011834 [Trichoderma lentiforme]|uniref:Uncharacterized protein n=1 Tax=Trichoderma lentiforme TaxID=1567552 RepID=A0A9P5C6X9_9HYPO|nr:hypothetical protein CFAM422_011834 [Trichoderma lentiforme]